jgi:hypothetical protein
MADNDFFQRLNMNVILVVYVKDVSIDIFHKIPRGSIKSFSFIEINPMHLLTLQLRDYANNIARQRYSSINVIAESPSIELPMAITYTTFQIAELLTNYDERERTMQIHAMLSCFDIDRDDVSSLVE